MANTTKIIIIGAGASGICAAAKLIEHGFEDILILEADDRIGGRILSVQFGSNDAVIDLGAQWVSGENEIYEMLVNHFCFGDTEIEPDTQGILSSDDRVIDTEACERLQYLGSEIWQCYDEMSSSDETFGEFFERKYFEALKTSDFADIDVRLAQAMLSEHHRVFNVHFATANWNQIPARVISDKEFCDGSQFITWGNYGFITLIHRLIVSVNH